MQYTMFNTKKKITLNYPKSAAMGFFEGTQKRARNSVLNEPSVFEPSKFNCKLFSFKKTARKHGRVSMPIKEQGPVVQN